MGRKVSISAWRVDDYGYIEPKASLELSRKSILCEDVTLQVSRHEILHEVDAVGDQAIERIVKYFKF